MKHGTAAASWPRESRVRGATWGANTGPHSVRGVGGHVWMTRIHLVVWRVAVWERR